MINMEWKGFRPMLLSNDEKDLESLDYVNNSYSISPKMDGCFIGSTKIQTDEGLLKIKDIVDNHMDVSVLSFNEKNSKLEYKKVVNWFNNGIGKKSDYTRLSIGRSKITCTHNHKILTNTGWKRADEIVDGDVGFKRTLNSHQKSLILASLLGDGCVAFEKRHENGGYRLIISNKEEEYVKHKLDCIGVSYVISSRISGFGTKMFVGTTCVMNDYDFNFKKINDHIKFIKDSYMTSELMSSLMTPEAVSLWIGDDGSLVNNNGNPETPRYSIHTEGHSKEQVKEFVKFFNQLGMSPSVYKNKKVKSNGEFLMFTTSDTFKLMDYIKDCSFKGKEYKLIGKYVEPTTLDIIQEKISVISNPSVRVFDKYDIEVEDNHNYIAENIVVHNCRVEITNEGLFGRSLKKIPNERLQEKYKQLCESLDEGEILEGEIWSPKMPCREIAGLCNRLDKSSKDNSIPEHLEIYLFDMYDESYMEKMDHRMRVDTLRVMFPIKDLKSLKIHVVEDTNVLSYSDVSEMYNIYIRQGFEGAVLFNNDSLYKKGRVTIKQDIAYKIKPHKEEDLLIIGVTERFINTNESNKNELGRSFKRNTKDDKQPTGIAASFECRLDNGIITKVAITGTEAFRKEIWDNKADYIGRWAVVLSMDFGVKDKPRHPRLTGIKEKIEK